MLNKPRQHIVELETEIDREAFILDLTHALSHADQELIRASRELAETREELGAARDRLAHEIAERKMVEEALVEAINGARAMRWHATVFADKITDEEAWLHWDLHFANEDAIKLWLPLEIPDGDTFVVAWHNAVDPADSQEIEPRGRNAIISGLSGYEQDFRLNLAPGDVMWIHEVVTITPDGPNRWLLSGKCTDVTGRKRKEEHVRISDAHSKLQALAFRDDLTGLHNRRAFHERFNLEFERAKRYHMPLSLIMLDVDRFKDYNDEYGHPAGDIVLKMVARLLQQNARDIDFVARYGGEEIAVIAPGDRAKSLIIAERLRVAFQQAAWPHRLITASFGVTTFQAALVHPTPDLLIAEADQALYVSKTNGRNRVTHAQPGNNPPPEFDDAFLINAGGSAVAGTEFREDSFFTGGTVRTIELPVDTSGLALSVPAALYQSERRGNFSYRISDILLGGMYLARLHFAETEESSIGGRIFDITVNGNIEAANFDILAEAGAPFRAVVKEFAVAVNAGGGIRIEFTGKTGLPVLNALEIVPLKYTDNISINCGDTDAWPFISDRYHVGGSSLRTASASDANLDQEEVDLTFPRSIYRSHRHGTFTYKIPKLPPGARCMVVLHFREMFQTLPGRRIFDVTINKIPALTGFDILAACPVPLMPIVKRCFATVNEDGELVIDFVPVVDLAQVVAIEVHW